MFRNIENTPQLTTKRLILRKFTYDDLEHFYEIFSQDEVNQFLPWYSLTSLEDSKSFFETKFNSVYDDEVGYRYAICLKEDNKPIGYTKVSIDETYDFGYGIRKEFWGKGIATEAGKALLERVKGNGIEYVTAKYDTRNPNSEKVMSKLGLSYKYSFQELWQPKNVLVTFRMHQMNFTKTPDFVYQGYWDKSTVRYVEENL